jgi:hypothetical protein
MGGEEGALGPIDFPEAFERSSSGRRGLSLPRRRASPPSRAATATAAAAAAAASATIRNPIPY